MLVHAATRTSAFEPLVLPLPRARVDYPLATILNTFIKKFKKTHPKKKARMNE